MTINWGHKVFLGFAAFAGMMIFLVYQCMNTRYELVSKEYYKDELQYQQLIDGKGRAHELSSPVTITQGENDVIVHFPSEMKEAIVTGSLWFYCASQAAKDRKIDLQLNGTATQTIPRHLLLPGRYTVRVNWQFNEEQYYSEIYTTIQ